MFGLLQQIPAIPTVGQAADKGEASIGLSAGGIANRTLTRGGEPHGQHEIHKESGDALTGDLAHPDRPGTVAQRFN